VPVRRSAREHECDLRTDRCGARRAIAGLRVLCRVLRGIECRARAGARATEEGFN